MSWVVTWLDTATAPSLATILAALDESGAQAINFYLGGRFSAGQGWTPELSAELAQARPDVGQFGTWVSLSPGQGGYALGHQDGLDCVAAAKAYSVIAWLVYDVEPETWQANPQGVDDAMRGFADAVHAAGYHAIDYGTPDTVAGASNEDVVWIANPNPGGGDPAVQPLDPNYYAGKRAVQYGSAVYAGITWDVTHSEFTISPGGDMSFTDADRELLSRLATDFFDGTQSTTPDGKSPVPADWPNFGPSMLALIPGLNAKADALLKAEGVAQAAIDAIAANGAAASQVATLLANLAALQTSVTNLGNLTAGTLPPSQQAELDAIKAATDGLTATATATAHHLGVGTA